VEVSVLRSRTWTAALVVGAAALLSSAGARADDCGCDTRFGGAVEALPAFKSAFAGRVESVREEGQTRIVTFRVFRAWKGPRGRQLTVITPASTCGVSFEQGAEYVVFATGTSDALRTDRCSPTSALAQAARSIRQLDLHSGYGSNPLRVPRAEGPAQARQ
jgi:hypothetical protein